MLASWTALSSQLSFKATAERMFPGRRSLAPHSSRANNVGRALSRVGMTYSKAPEGIECFDKQKKWPEGACSACPWSVRSRPSTGKDDSMTQQLGPQNVFLNNLGITMGAAAVATSVPITVPAVAQVAKPPQGKYFPPPRSSFGHMTFLHRPRRGAR